MDALAIVTGISLLVFLLFYLALNLSKDHDILKLILVMVGLFILTFIPQQLDQTNRDCGILANGSYICYLSNGSQVTNYGSGNVIGRNLYVPYVYLLWVVIVYIFLYLIWKVIKNFGFIEKFYNQIRRKMR
jgi:hypothetical protein